MKKEYIESIILLTGTAIETIAGFLLFKDNNTSEKELNESINQKVPSANTTPKKSYHGYVPKGCESCGGPYPICRDGCFDD